jgi:hypothetical protein
MKNNAPADRETRELLRAARLAEFHGDRRCECWGAALQQPPVRRRAELYAALDQCRTWWDAVPPPQPVPTWQRLRDGVFGLTAQLALAVTGSGQLLIAWGREARDALQQVAEMPGALVPQRVALGEADNLDMRAGTVTLAAGEGGDPCEIQAFASKDGTVALEVRMPARQAERPPWSAELWREDNLLQRLPGRQGVVRFSRPLCAGRHQLVLRMGRERYTVEIDMA